MTQESLGYIKLEWICPKCGSRNPGPEKTCLSCGFPQPENVQFVQAETQALITDEKEIAQAKAGPDIHCAFCGARNPAGSDTCSQCGADLKEGTLRETGKVVGAFQSGPEPQIACKNCGTLNNQSALKCSACGASLHLETTTASKPTTKPNNRFVFLFVGLMVFCLAALVIYLVLGAKTEGYRGVVQSVQWESSLPILGLQPVRHQDWFDEIPADARIGICNQKAYARQNQPAANAIKVCGTPYTVDRGSGYAEVVQDCQYEIMKDYCDYTVEEWVVVDTAVLSGSDFFPQSPQPSLLAGQRLGDVQTEYSVVFETDQETYVYKTSDINAFRQFTPGSKWQLNINTFGNLVSVEPLQ